MGFLSDILSFFKAKPAAVKTAKSQGKYNAAVANKLNAKARVFVFDKSARRAAKRAQAVRHQHVTDFHWLEKIDNSYPAHFEVQYLEDAGFIAITVDNHEYFTIKAYWNYTPPTPPPEPGGHFQLSIENDPLSLKNVLIFSDLWQFSGRELTVGKSIVQSIEADGNLHGLLFESADLTQAENIAVYIDEEPPGKETVSFFKNDTPYPEVTILDSLRNGDILKLGVLLTSAVIKNFIFSNRASSLFEVHLIQINGLDFFIQPGAAISRWLGYDSGVYSFTINPVGDPFLVYGIHLSLIRQDFISQEDWDNIFNYTNDDLTVSLTVNTDNLMFSTLMDVPIKFLLYHLGQEFYTIKFANNSGALVPPDYDGIVQITSDDIPGFTTASIKRGETLDIPVNEMDKVHHIRCIYPVGSHFFVHVEVLPSAQNYVSVRDNDSTAPELTFSNDCYWEQELPINVRLIEQLDFNIELNWQNHFDAESESDIDVFTGIFQNTVISATANSTEAHYVIVRGKIGAPYFMIDFAAGSETEGATITRLTESTLRIDFALNLTIGHNYKFNLYYDIIPYPIRIDINTAYPIILTSDLDGLKGTFTGSTAVAVETSSRDGGHYVIVNGSGVQGYTLQVTNNSGTSQGLTITQQNAYTYRVDFDAEVPYGANYRILAREVLSLNP